MSHPGTMRLQARRAMIGRAEVRSSRRVSYSGIRPSKGGLGVDISGASLVAGKIFGGSSGAKTRPEGASTVHTAEMHEDTTLVRRTLAGDQEAFAALVEKYKDAVFNVAYRMLGNATEAEDVAQETFVRAYTQLKTYQEGRRFSTWLLSIASHL